MNRNDLQALYDTINHMEPFSERNEVYGENLEAEIRRLKHILKAVIEVLVQVAP